MIPDLFLCPKILSVTLIFNCCSLNTYNEPVFTRFLAILGSYFWIWASWGETPEEKACTEAGVFIGLGAMKLGSCT